MKRRKDKQLQLQLFLPQLGCVDPQALLKLPHFQPQLCSRMMVMMCQELVKLPHSQPQLCSRMMMKVIKEDQPALPQHRHPKPLHLPPAGIEGLQALVKETRPALPQHLHPKPLHLPPAGTEGLQVLVKEN
jgi:hypothetical protein